MQKKQVAPLGGRDNQIKRTARVLEIIQQITSAPGYWSRRKLAAYHEYSERTIQKDLEIIKIRLNLPLDHNGKGYYFLYLPQLPTTVYSFSEAVALLMAARSAQTLPGINSAELSAAIARLESIFPEELRPLLQEATEQLPQQASRSHRQLMLAVLNRALMEKHQLEIIYATGYRDGDVDKRVVEPYYLMPYGRSWHLIAYDHKRDNVLQFKVDRIQQAALLNERYTIPASFDVDEYMGDAWGLMRGAAGEPEDVVLLFEPEAGRWVAEEQWHRSQANEKLPDGRMQLTFHVGVTPEMVSWLLYYGGNVWVERPLWLQVEVRKQHQRAMDRVRR